MNLNYFLLSGLLFLCCASSQKNTTPVATLIKADSLKMSYSSWETPERIEGEMAVFDTTTNLPDQLYAFILANKEIFKISSPAADLVIKSQVRDELGYWHIKFDHSLKKLPVLDEQLYFHINNKGSLYLYTGQYHPELTDNFSAKPLVTLEQAEKNAADSLGLETFYVTGAINAVYYVDSPVLVYKFVIGKTQLALNKWECVVNAYNGEIIKKIQLNIN